MKFIKPLMITFGVLILLLIGFGIAQTFFRWSWPTEFGAADIIMCVALGIFCVLIIIGAFGQKFNVKRLGSYALHFGLVFFLLGTLLYTITGVSVMTSVPVNNSVMYESIEGSDGTIHKLGFSFNIENFQIEYYEPVYDVYLMTTNGVETVMTDIELENGYYNFGKYGGKYKLEQLVTGSTILQQINLGGDYVAIVRMPVKTYTATLLFSKDGKMERKNLLVNYPLRENGYKIYLMSFNESANSVTLLFKYDIGEYVAVIGIVITMLGTFYHCLVYPALEDRTRKLKKKAYAAAEAQKKAKDGVPMSETVGAPKQQSKKGGKTK